MSKNLVERITAIPLKRRYYQIANWTIATLFGRALNLVHVAEYPRCGGTWIRHMLQDAMGIPQYAMNRHLTSGTIIQTHSLPQPAIRKPIVILRDPRDIMVSFYFKKIHFDKKIRSGAGGSIGKFQHDPERETKADFCEFLRAHLVSPEHPRFHFREFANAWVFNRTNSFTVRYEDCKADAEHELRRMLDFVGKEVDNDKILAAVEKNSFENRTLKRSGKTRRPGQADTGQFERKGIVGDWKNVFNLEAARIFDMHEGQALIELGYESSSDWVSQVV